MEPFLTALTEKNWFSNTRSLSVFSVSSPRLILMNSAVCADADCWCKLFLWHPCATHCKECMRRFYKMVKKKKKGGWHVLPLSVNCAEENSAINAKQRILLNLGSTTLHRGPLWIVNESNSSCYSWFDFKQLFLFINFVNKHIRFLFCNVF